MESLLLADLITEVPDAIRLQRITETLKQHFRCDAVGLLRLDEGSLRMIAASGLADDALGRRFAVAEHPRFATILSRREPTWFEPGSVLPDPYDGLLDDRRGAPLPVHDCLGMSLFVEGKLWGALTMDALATGTFDTQALISLQRYALLLEAAIRVTMLERENRNLRQLGSGIIEDNRIFDDKEIIGRSDAISQLLHELDVVADSDLPILLLGETGVGKELFARRVHRYSRRRNKPMIHVNAPRFPSRWPRASCSAMSKVPSPEQHPIAPDGSKPLRAAPCFWMKSANCRWLCRPSFCVRCKTAKYNAWARTRQSKPMSELSLPPIGT